MTIDAFNEDRKNILTDPITGRMVPGNQDIAPDDYGEYAYLFNGNGQ